MVALQQLQTPWQNVGTTIDIPAGERTSDILDAYGLNWEVAKRELFTLKGDRMKDNYGIMRLNSDGTETPLGVVGSRYEPLQNRDAMRMINKAAATLNGRFSAAGTFNDGKIVWAQVQIGDPIKIAGDDIIHRNLTILNSHDGSVSLSMMLTPLRIFCMNMLAQMKNTSIMRSTLRHTLTVMEKLESLTQDIIEGASLIEKSTALYRHLAQSMINTEQLGMFFKAIFPDGNTDRKKTMMGNKREELMSIYERGRGTDMTPHTFWRAWNAVVEWVDYYSGRSEDSRVRGAIMGAGRAIKERALDVAVKIIDGVYIPEVVLDFEEDEI